MQALSFDCVFSLSRRDVRRGRGFASALKLTLWEAAARWQYRCSRGRSVGRSTRVDIISERPGQLETAVGRSVGPPEL